MLFNVRPTGLTLQERPDTGEMLSVRETVPVNSPTAVTLIAEVPVCPGKTVVTRFDEIVKS